MDGRGSEYYDELSAEAVKTAEARHKEVRARYLKETSSERTLEIVPPYSDLNETMRGTAPLQALVQKKAMRMVGLYRKREYSRRDVLELLDFARAVIVECERVLR